MGILIPEGIEENNYISILIKKLSENHLKKIKKIIPDIGFFVSDECNLNCQYCVVSKTQKNADNILNFPKAIKTIDYFFLNMKNITNLM